MSARLSERRAESEARATASLIERAGLTPDAYFAAIQAAYVTWCIRAPWRWLPARVQGWTFDHFAGRLAARFVARWNDD